MFLRGIILFSIMLLIFCSCNKAADELLLSERVQIRAFLQQEGITDYIEDEKSGYFYYIIDSGRTAEDSPNAKSTVEMNYEASLLDGTIIEDTYSGGSPAFIELSSAIPGLKLVLPKFFIGTEAQVVLPSRLGYGESGLGTDVPPNSILQFKVEIIEIHPHF